jgi:hypothetical protein
VAQGDPTEAFEFVIETFDNVPLPIKYPVNLPIVSAGLNSFDVGRGV